MVQNRWVLVVAVFLFLPWLSTPSLAQEKHFQLAFIAPTMQLVDDDDDITGVRLNLLYGKNANVYGVDLGLVNHVSGEMKGWQLGVVNLVDERYEGWQAGIVNLAREDFKGLQFAAPSILPLANFARRGEGAQIAWAFNRSERFSGFQLSLVNVADDMHGLQVGLVNIIRSNRDHPVLPLVNWKFDRE